MDTGIGASVTRKEDYRFLTGQGRYTDDISRPGQTHAVFVRSNVAHANLNGVDTAAAEAAPGVLAVFTGADLEGVGGVPCGFAPDGGPMNEPPRPVLAQGKVPVRGRHGGAGHRRDARAGQGRRRTRQPPVRGAAGGGLHGGPRRPRARRCCTICPTTAASAGGSVMPRQPTRRSPTPITSPRWSWSTTASAPTPSNRARPSRSTMRAATATPSTPRARIPT